MKRRGTHTFYCKDKINDSEVKVVSANSDCTRLQNCHAAGIAFITQDIFGSRESDKSILWSLNRALTLTFYSSVWCVVLLDLRKSHRHFLF